MRAVTTVTTGLWQLVADTDDPDPQSTPRALVTPLTAQWVTDQLPPVAQPDTVTIRIFDRGTTPAYVGAPRWLPLSLGEPITVYVRATNDAGTAIGQPLTFTGRIADVTAENVPGGLLFTVICSSRLADLGGVNAPNLVGSGGAGVWLENAYAAIAADAGVLIDTDDGNVEADATEYLIDGNAMDNTGTSSLDVLGQLALQDARFWFDGDFALVTHYLAFPADPDLPTPTDEAYVTVAYDPRITDLADVLILDYDGSQWYATDNPDYYGTVADPGVLLYAEQCLADIGSWLVDRAASINIVEMQGTFVGGTESVRATHPDLVASQGPNSRSLTTPATTTTSAGGLASVILGDRDQVNLGFGLQQLTVLWSTLLDEQIESWGSQLWSTIPQRPPDPSTSGPIGRPVAIARIPDEWDLADGPVVMGRLMGLTVTVDVARYSVGGEAASGFVSLGLSLRAIPPRTDVGITPLSIEVYYDVLPGGPITPANLDPAITPITASLIGIPA